MDLCIECNIVVTGRKQALECNHCHEWQDRGSTVFVVQVIILYTIILFFSASMEFYLLCHLLKSEADQVVITVMEVFREEQSVRRVRARSRSNTDLLQFLGHEILRLRNAISLVQAASNMV